MDILDKILNYKNFKIKFFLLISFIIVWTSVGSSYNNLLIFYSNETITISEIVNFFRVLLIILIFPILSFFFINNLITTNNIRLKENFLVYTVFIYFFLQIPGLFYTNNSIENLIYVISALNFLIILNLSIKIFKYNEMLILIYLIFIILFSVLVFAFSKDLIDFFFEDQFSKKFYGQLHTIFGNNTIRSSGTSRISLVLMVIYMSVLRKHINSRIYKEVPIFIFSTIIFLYESRAIVLLLVLFLIINLFFRFYEKKFFNNLIKYFIFFFMLPLLLALQINDKHAHYKKVIFEEEKYLGIIIKGEQILMTQIINYSLSYIPIYSSYTALDDFSYYNLFSFDNLWHDHSSSNKTLIIESGASNKKIDSPSDNSSDLISTVVPKVKVNIFCKVIKCADYSSRLINAERLFTSSGRFRDWKEIFHRYDDHALILGYGSQGDRYLINQTASNAMMYAFSSTGIIGLSFFIFFSFVISLKIIKLFFSKKINDPLVQLSFFILIVVLVRSLIESSYAVFSIDFMLFSISLFLLNKYNINRI